VISQTAPACGLAVLVDSFPESPSLFGGCSGEAAGSKDSEPGQGSPHGNSHWESSVATGGWSAQRFAPPPTDAQEMLLGPVLRVLPRGDGHVFVGVG
jgi:hypothetical protein